MFASYKWEKCYIEMSEISRRLCGTDHLKNALQNKLSFDIKHCMLHSPVTKAEYVQSLTYLDKVSWQPFRTITIIEGKSCAECGQRNTKGGSSCHHHTP
jgi:hypothetical protein